MQEPYLDAVHEPDAEAQLLALQAVLDAPPRATPAIADWPLLRLMAVLSDIAANEADGAG